MLGTLHAEVGPARRLDNKIPRGDVEEKDLLQKVVVVETTIFLSFHHNDLWGGDMIHFDEHVFFKWVGSTTN